MSEGGRRKRNKKKKSAHKVILKELQELKKTGASVTYDSLLKYILDKTVFKPRKKRELKKKVTSLLMPGEKLSTPYSWSAPTVQAVAKELAAAESPQETLKLYEKVRPTKKESMALVPYVEKKEGKEREEKHGTPPSTPQRPPRPPKPTPEQRKSFMSDSARFLADQQRLQREAKENEERSKQEAHELKIRDAKREIHTEILQEMERQYKRQKNEHLINTRLKERSLIPPQRNASVIFKLGLLFPSYDTHVLPPMDTVRQDYETIKQSLITSDPRFHKLVGHGLKGGKLELGPASESSKAVYQTIKEKGMMSDEIDTVMMNVPGWQCVVARDQGLPIKKKAARMCWIKNLDNADEEGSHWCTVVITETTAEWYDSFGRECPNDILDQILKVGSPDSMFKENLVVMQNAKTSTCGIFACMFAVKRMQNIPFDQATGFKQQKDSMKGEEEAKKFAEKYPPFRKLSMRGAGISDWIGRVKDFLSGNKRDGAPPAIRKLMEQNGDQLMLNITVCREPVQRAVTKVLNVVTLGAFNSAMKSMGYDQMFHLYMFIELPRKTFRLEKNHVVQTSSGAPPSNAEKVKIPVKNRLTLLDFMEKGEKRAGKEKFWQYDAFKYNCQDFILNLLQASNLATPEATKFIKQDAEGLLKKLPSFTDKFAKTLTDVAAAGDKLINGNGKRKKTIQKVACDK